MSEEHIIPESLGNTSHVLRGVVCDKCNSFYHKLEEYFTHHHIASASRLLKVDRTKKGAEPSQKLPKGEGRRKGDQFTFSQSLIPGKESEQFSITILGEEIRIEHNTFLQDADATKLSRLLCKIGLETLSLKKGDLAYSEEYDTIRRFARFGRGAKFIPFAWRYQNAITADLRLIEMTSQKDGVFHVALIFVPGIAYFVQLHRHESAKPLDYLVTQMSLNKVGAPGMIPRDPIKFEARLGPEKGKSAPNEGAT